MGVHPSSFYSEILRRDFSAFVHRSFLELNGGSLFLPNWHVDVLAAKLEDVRHGRCKRLIINIPPRSLKSIVAAIAFPAWLLGHDPFKRVLTVSYAQDLSEKFARDSRVLMTSSFYQGLFDTRLSPDRQSVSDFETTKGGFRFSTSVAGVLTGRGADIIIIDDPLKADDALSETRRRSVNEWYDNSLRSRLNSQEEGAIIIVMQRLHMDDLVAHVQKHEKWDVVSIPALAEKDEIYEISTPYGPREIVRRAGEALNPALQSEKILVGLRASMTDYNFSAQYQQDPQPAAGLIVRREYLKFYKPNEKPERFEKIVQSWDTANKATELSNYSVCTTWGLYKKHFYLLDVHRSRMEFPALKRMVRELASLWRANIVLVEDKASGTQLIQDLRAEGFRNILPAPAIDGDKQLRLRGETGKIDGGFVLFPESAPFLDTYLLELTGFPNAKHDDQVDSTVYALAWFGEDRIRPRGFFDSD